MTKTEYKKARQLVRENGEYGLRFIERIVNTLTACQYQTYWYCIFKGQVDKLKERQQMVEYFKEQNFKFNFRQIQ